MSMALQSEFLCDEAATVDLGVRIGNALTALRLPNHQSCDFTIYLSGELGAGKTTFTRGLLNCFGHSGAVKSPTYTLVEPYQLDKQAVFHFDLYRLADPEELEYLGIRDYFSEKALRIIEWPQKAEGVLPLADLFVGLEVEMPGRKAELNANSELGAELLGQLAQISAQ